MVHVSRLNTAYEIWKSLEAIHETQDYQVAISIQHNLFRQCTTDNDDLAKHLTKLKRDWEHLNVMIFALWIYNSRQLSPLLSLYHGIHLPNLMLDVAEALSKLIRRSLQVHNNL